MWLEWPLKDRQLLPDSIYSALRQCYSFIFLLPLQNLWSTVPSHACLSFMYVIARSYCAKSVWSLLFTLCFPALLVGMGAGKKGPLGGASRRRGTWGQQVCQGSIFLLDLATNTKQFNFFNLSFPVRRGGVGLRCEALLLLSFSH